MAVLITTKERNWKRILPQSGNPNSRVDSDEEEKAVPAYSRRSTTGKPAGPFQNVISVIIRLHFIATNIYYIMTVYDTKSGPHTTIILLDTASKQTNKQTSWWTGMQYEDFRYHEGRQMKRTATTARIRPQLLLLSWIPNVHSLISPFEIMIMFAYQRNFLSLICYEEHFRTSPQQTVQYEEQQCFSH